MKSAAAARKRVQADLFAEAPGKTAQALTELAGKYPKVAALMEGLADGSPYLWDAIAASPARWLSLLQANPDEHLAALLAKIAAAASALGRR